jgi:hypothetical protein
VAAGAGRARPAPRTLALYLLLIRATAAAATQHEEPRSLGADSVRVWYWPGDEAFAHATLEAIPSLRFPGIPHGVVGEQRSVSVTLAPDVETFRRIAPGVPRWGAGLAFPDRGAVVIPLRGSERSPHEWRRTLHHEIAHLALSDFLHARIPRWFDEGYAQLAAATWEADAAWQLRLAILLGRAPPLDSLTLDFPARAPEARVAYLLSYTAVRDLYQLSGPDAFTAVLRRWRENGDLDAAMRETYGLTLGQFERLWRHNVRSRYGWLLIVSETVLLWTAFTLLFLALGAWARRRRRQQFAALKAREAHEAPQSFGEPLEGDPRVDPPADTP